jgi:ribosomal protein S1
MILPGDRVKCKVVKVIRQGIFVGFLGDIRATVTIDHLDKLVDSSKIQNEYKEGKKIQGRIIFIDYFKKIICVSLNKDIVRGKKFDHGDINVGDMIENATVACIWNHRLVLTHPLTVKNRDRPKQCIIIVPNFEISDKKKYGNALLKEKFDIGEKVKLRIRFFRAFGGYFVGSTKKSYFSQQYASIKDYKPGDIVHVK